MIAKRSTGTLSLNEYHVNGSGEWHKDIRPNGYEQAVTNQSSLYSIYGDLKNTIVQSFLQKESNVMKRECNVTEM